MATAAALAMIAAGMALVRLGWGGVRLAGPAGWTLAAATLVTLAVREGAWGVATGLLVAVASALGAVLVAAWRTPAYAMRPPRTAPPMRQTYAASDIARRVSIFVLVVPAGFAASAWLAVAIHHCLRGHGLGGADAAVCCWFAQPIAWTALIAWQMTRAGTRAMLAPLAVAAGMGGLLWAAA